MKKKPQTSTVNLSPDVARDLDQLVAEHEPFVRRHAVHVAALRLGLDELLKDRSKLASALRQRAST